MIHFELKGWNEAVTEKLTQKEWVNSMSLALIRKYEKRRLLFDPQINDFYTALVAALPAAVEVSKNEDGKHALSRVARLAVACHQYRIEDFLPYMAAESSYDLLHAISEYRPIPQTYWPVFFDYISETIQASSISETTKESCTVLRGALFMISDLIKKTPKCNNEARMRFSELLSALADLFQQEPPERFDSSIRNNVFLVQDRLYGR